MENGIDLYGTMIVACAKNDGILLENRLDVERYVRCLNKMVCPKRQLQEGFIIGGFVKNKATLIFNGGDEEILKKTIQKTHISYSAYRRNKNNPIIFGKTKYILLDNKESIINAMNDIKYNSEYICTSLNECKVVLTMLNSGLKENVSYDNKPTRNFDIKEYEIKRKIIMDLRKEYKLTYREISKIFSCSSATIYRILNK